MGYYISSKWYRSAPGMLAHWCPGCNERHFIYVKEKDSKASIVWDFNSDFNQPSFNPSICHQTNAPRNIGEMAQPVTYTKCHYFIKNGMIEFCPDSLHSLAGQTVILPDFPSHILHGD